ncbi:MAG TPA: L,D-transpeptidase [Polyangiaceae bacterium]|nr:L,D-transpeptidase [Polyangiaceae bacterium]
MSALLLAVGCSGSEQPESQGDDESIPEVPTPPENGPKLIAVRHNVVVRDRPSPSGRVLGTLRAGGQVARAEQPYSKRNCPGGWYPIRPRGFVCAGEEATIDMASPAAQLLAAGPKFDEPMPYRYGKVTRNAAVLYGKLPTVEEQNRAEPKIGKKKGDPEPIGTGPNDVPLDENGRATGPPVLLPTAEGVNKEGYRMPDTWFDLDETNGQSLAAPGLAIDPAAAATRVLKSKSGLAVARTITFGEGEAKRHFGILPDGRFVDVQRLAPMVGGAFYGVDLEKEGLPAAFIIRGNVPTFKMENRRAVPTDESYEAREHLFLSGRFRTVDQVKYFATRDEELWVRHRDIVYVPKRSDFPDFALENARWLDISLANQYMVVWHGRKPIYATLISSGQDRLGDPKEGPATIQGVFRLRAKHVTRAVDERETNHAYSVGDAPWVMEFAEGFSLIGCYWHTAFGEARSYHDIGLSPIDARWIFNWSEPAIPDGWHSVSIAEDEPTTVVYVHK